MNVEDIQPLPKMIFQDISRKRKRQKSEILTSTPVKEELEAQQSRKKTKMPKSTKLKELFELHDVFPQPPVC